MFILDCINWCGQPLAVWTLTALVTGLVRCSVSAHTRAKIRRPGPGTVLARLWAHQAVTGAGASEVSVTSRDWPQLPGPGIIW